MSQHTHIVKRLPCEAPTSIKAVEKCIRWLDWFMQAARRSVLQQTRHLLDESAFDGTASRTLVIVDDNMQYRQALPPHAFHPFNLVGFRG